MCVSTGTGKANLSWWASGKDGLFTNACHLKAFQGDGGCYIWWQLYGHIQAPKMQLNSWNLSALLPVNHTLFKDFLNLERKGREEGKQRKERGRKENGEKGSGEAGEDEVRWEGAVDFGGEPKECFLQSWGSEYLDVTFPPDIHYSSSGMSSCRINHLRRHSQDVKYVFKTNKEHGRKRKHWRQTLKSRY